MNLTIIAVYFKTANRDAYVNKVIVEYLEISGRLPGRQMNAHRAGHLKSNFLDQKITSAENIQKQTN